MGTNTYKTFETPGWFLAYRSPALPVSKEGHFLEGSENLKISGALRREEPHPSL